MLIQTLFRQKSDLVIHGDVAAGGGLGGIVRVVIHLDFAVADFLQNGVVLVHGESAEVPACFVGGQANIVALFQAKVAVGASDGAPVACIDGLQAILNGSAQTLHGGGNKRVCLVLAGLNTLNAQVVLVNVNADQLAVMLVSSFSSRSPDAAAAGEHNFGAAIVPAVHLSGDLLIAIELTAVVVVI